LYLEVTSNAVILSRRRRI